MKRRYITKWHAALAIAEYGAELTKDKPHAYYIPYRDVGLRILHWNDIGNFNKGKWRDWLREEHLELYHVVWPNGTQS